MYRCEYFDGLPYVRLTAERSVIAPDGGAPQIRRGIEDTMWARLEVGSVISWECNATRMRHRVVGFRDGLAVVMEVAAAC